MRIRTADSPDDISILGIALEKNLTEVVARLIEKGAEPDGNMPTGEMVLPWAIRNNRLGAVRSMFAHGADPHITDRDGIPLLHIAIESGHKDLVKTLIEHGADPGAADPSGQSTLALALRNGWNGILPTLASAGADPNLPSPSGKTLLEQAIEDRDTRTIPLLMRIGADPVRLPTMPGGVTPLEAAIASGHPETLEAVLRPGEILSGPEWEPALWLAYRQDNLGSRQHAFEKRSTLPPTSSRRTSAHRGGNPLPPRHLAQAPDGLRPRLGKIDLLCLW